MREALWDPSSPSTVKRALTLSQKSKLLKQLLQGCPLRVRQLRYPSSYQRIHCSDCLSQFEAIINSSPNLVVSLYTLKVRLEQVRGLWGKDEQECEHSSKTRSQEESDVQYIQAKQAKYYHCYFEFARCASTLNEQIEKATDLIVASAPSAQANGCSPFFHSLVSFAGIWSCYWRPTERHSSLLDSSKTFPHKYCELRLLTSLPVRFSVTQAYSFAVATIIAQQGGHPNAERPEFFSIITHRTL